MLFYLQGFFMSDIQQFILNKLEKLDEKLDEVKEQNIKIKANFDSHAIMDQEMHEQIIKLANNIDKHSNLLDEYNKQLEIHIKRTDILEQKVLPLIIEKKDTEIVRKWWSVRFATILKIAGWLSGVAGFIIILLELISKLR
jgi:hypothetical protein